MALPTLDFSTFLHGDHAEQKRIGHALIDSLKRHGFVKLINHGIPEDTVKAFLDGTKNMFSMPVSAKAEFENEKGPKPQRGWSCKGAEVTAKLRKANITEGTGDDLKDEREFFDCGPPEDREFPNKWPAKDYPEFQPLMEECYVLLQKAGLQILEAMEVGLEISPGTLVDMCKPAASEIRLNHYPPMSLHEHRHSKTKRTWPHTDFGIITLLFQDKVGGLELEDRSQPGTFMPVLPGKDDAPSELVVNISDTFERWSNGQVPAGVHRVDIPNELKDKDDGVCPDRYSSIFFFKASRDTSVGPLPAFVSADTPAKFDDITALQYQRRMTSVLY